ncbi:MAG: hypothetical protein KAX38_07775, partial [Candidatus Krumholzibacteria bacterium]|nr:hypothetical protein [Candidatus Krumholzibacteria bacterium]
WRYFDTDDPTHPGSSELSNVIVDFHHFLDECIGQLESAAGEDAILMIISDHGHTRRPPLFFNLNQLLLENGLLKSRIRGPKLISPRYILERIKNSTLETLHRLDREDLAYRIAHLFPWTRKLKNGDFLTEPSANLATASEFGGNNPFGGVEISKERCAAEGIEYEAMRDRIIDLLLGTTDENSEPVFAWVKRREEIYKGTFINKFPDLLYEMKPCYGTNWSLHLPLITVNPRHRKISGGHRANSVLIVGPLDGWRINRSRISPLNITATVLNVLSNGAAGNEVPPGKRREKGQSFLEKD